MRTRDLLALSACFGLISTSCGRGVPSVHRHTGCILQAGYVICDDGYSFKLDDAIDEPLDEPLDDTLDDTLDAPLDCYSWANKQWTFTQCGDMKFKTRLNKAKQRGN